MRPNGLWDEPRMDALLARYASVAVSGTAENQGRFYDRFEHVVYLVAPVGVLLARTAARTNNPYGRSPEDQAQIARYVADVEPLIRCGASVELDARRPVTELARDVTRLLGPP
jgi:shikimate kinase